MYWFDFSPTSEYRIRRMRADGTFVWSIDSNEDARLLDAATNVRLTSTPEGVFIPLTTSRFYRVTPDGTASLALVANGTESRGLEVTGAEGGDHFACYLNIDPTDDTIAGFDGVGSRRWGLDQFALNDLELSACLSVQLSPDGSALIGAFETWGFRWPLAGFDPEDGSLLWRATPIAPLIANPSTQANDNVRLRFAGAHAFLTVSRTVVIATFNRHLGVTYRLDWPDGYTNPPVVTWAREWTDPTASGLADQNFVLFGAHPMPDGGVLVQAQSTTSVSPPVPLARRYDANGTELWASSFDDDLAVAATSGFPALGNQIIAHDGFGFTAVTDLSFSGADRYRVRRFDLGTGAFSENAEFPKVFTNHYGFAPSEFPPPTPDPGPLPVPRIQDPSDYVRLSVSVDAGSLLDSTNVPVVESGISIVFDPLVTLDQGALYPVWEPLRERGVGDPDHVFYPRGVQSNDRLAHYAGETILSWIDRVKAPRLFAKVSDIPALAGSLIDGRFVTLQVAVDYWFSQLAARFAPRFQYAPVPDLRYATTDGIYDADQGTPLVELFTFDQPTGSELTVRQILDQMLSVCGGQAAVLVKQDAQGRLELIPSVGPDAITEPVLVLTGDDIERVTTGDRDPRQSFNSATARNTVWTEQDDVGIMQPAWFQVGSIGRFGTSGWFEAPPDRLNLQPTSDPTEPLQETFTTAMAFNQQRPGLWRVSDEALPGAGGIRLRDSGGTYMVELAWRRYLGTGSLQESGTDGLVTFLDEIPTTGEWVTPFGFRRVVGVETASVDIQMRYAGPAGVEIRYGAANRQLETACFIAPCDLWIVEFNISDASRGFAPRAELSATFSLANGDALPSTTGGNALAESEAEFGVQHADLNISVVSLGPTDLADLARAFVIANIEPKLVREVEQSPARGFPVRAEHLGYRVQLPSGEVGRVPSRTIDAEYARPGTASIRSSFRAEITEVRLDTTSAFLTTLSGAFLQGVAPPNPFLTALEAP